MLVLTATLDDRGFGPLSPEVLSAATAYRESPPISPQVWAGRNHQLGLCQRHRGRCGGGREHRNACSAGQTSRQPDRWDRPRPSAHSVNAASGRAGPILPRIATAGDS